MLHRGYHPLKHRTLRILFGRCTVDITLLSICPLRIVLGWEKSGYHPLNHRPLRIVLGWKKVDIIFLRIVLLGKWLDGAHCISSS